MRLIIAREHYIIGMRLLKDAKRKKIKPKLRLRKIQNI